MIVCIPVNGWVSAIVKGFQTKQMKLKDQRLRGLNEILNGIKVLKVMNEKKFSNVFNIKFIQFLDSCTDGKRLSFKMCWILGNRS